jgi:exodeoxyribonuclease VII small subunit
MTAEEMSALRFEEAYKLLEETLDELRREGLSLEHSLTLYERGTRLAAHCDNLLAQAELRVTELTPGQGEAITRVVRESFVDSQW